MTDPKVSDVGRQLRFVSLVLKRLSVSDTQRKRKNARLALRQSLAAIYHRADSLWPPLDRSGHPRCQNRKGYQCPLCRVPMKSAVVLASHLVSKHGLRISGTNMPKCVCGAYFQFTQRVNSISLFARHLSAVHNLKAHFLLGKLKQAAI